MMETEDTILPSGGEKEKQEGEEDVEEDYEGEKSSGDDAKKTKSLPHVADEKIKLPAQTEEKKKKQADVLNLNNEVVKMRKEVKRVKALIIRKLTRQINVLKKKKGKEADIERNQRRAARLLEEVHCMKKLQPDLVTKTALQKNLNFEQMCKNPKSTISDRAVARIASHPQFNEKIQRIKDAVKTFKKEHTKSGKQGERAKVPKQSEKAAVPSSDARRERKSGGEEEDYVSELQEAADSEEEDSGLKITEDAALVKSGEDVAKATRSADFGVYRKEMPECNSAKPSSVKSALKKDSVNRKAGETDSDLQPALAVLHKQAEEEESDVESSDGEEKEYFDDSTEERFYKRSSQSEMSGDESDDFFIGKVSRFKKKKKKQTDAEAEKKMDKGQEVKKDSTDKVQSELDKLEARMKSKAASLQSVFCSSLSRDKAGRGSGRARGGAKFGGVNRSSLSRQPKFQNREKGASVSESKYTKPCPEDRWSTSDRTETRGRGRGRGILPRKDHRGGHGFTHQVQQPPLHPSWEASKKRKEQQGQILAFQGKKIKFDDDD